MADANWLVIGLTALIGAGIGAGLKEFIEWMRRPILELRFEPEDRLKGCEVNTPTENPTVQQRYLRVRVHNRGRTGATDVRVGMTRLDLSPSTGDRQPPLAHEVLALGTSLESEAPVPIPHGTFRYFDLFLTQQDGAGPVAGMVIVKTYPQAMQQRGFNIPGVYEANLFIAAKDAAPSYWMVRWNWDGTLLGSTILNCSERPPPQFVTD